MQEVQRQPTSAFVNVAGIALYCRLSLNSHRSDRRENIVALSRERRRKATRRGRRVVIFGNEKIFVGKTAFASFEVVQAGFANESQLRRFGVEGVSATVEGGCELGSRRVHARATRARGDRARAYPVGSCAKDNIIVLLVQMPSFDFKSSLTAFGFALPPDDFIT